MLTIVVGPPILVFAIGFLAYFPIVDLPIFSDQQSDVQEAARFGALELPADATVLDVEIDRHRDRSYELELALSPAGVDELLERNGLAARPAQHPFSGSPAPDRYGDGSRDVLHLQDELPPRLEYREPATRRVAVDRTDAQRPTVYISIRES